MTETIHKYTYNLVNMNEALNALKRAIKLMAVRDHHLEDHEQGSIERTIEAELALVNEMISYRYCTS